MTYAKEIKFAQKLARDAGEIIRRYFLAEDIGTTNKDNTTPITVADTTINDMVISRVKLEFPDHGVHGEEASFGTDRRDIWVCDPVDGTIPFSLGLPLSTFSLAFTHDGEPQLGVVYDPFNDRMYVGAKGEGSTVNGVPLRVSSQELDESYVDLEMIGSIPGAVPVDDIRAALIQRGARPFSLLSFIIGAMMVAEGRFTGTFFGFTKPEDIAAAKVIVEEAGGKVTDMDGNDQRYDRRINAGVITNGVVHEDFLQLIAAAKRPK